MVGNRLIEIKDGKQTTSVYNSLNQLASSTEVKFGEEDLPDTTISEKAYSYDANGSQIQAGDSITGETLEYTFDAANRLSTYVEKQSGTITLTQTNQYNGNGQRIIKTETAGSNPVDVVNYFYQDGKVLYTTGSDANKAFNILGAGDNIIATEHQNTSGVASYYFYNKDLRGSTTNILGSDYLAKASYTYDWFGNTEVFEPTGTNFYNQICYTGGIYDESTQLYYLNARFYDPADGRFLSQDTYRGTLEDANSWHLYAYCANNPIKYSDPSGHFVWLAIGVAFAIYDGVTAYKQAKKEGKSGWSAVGAVAKGVAVGAIFGKIGKAFKATSKAVQIGKKIYKSKPLKKLFSKPPVFKGLPPRIKASTPPKKVHPPSYGIQGGSGAKLGGAYKDVPANGGQVHHMPADSISALSKGEGPSIRMEAADHMDTASWGRSKNAQTYRQTQKELIEQGKFNEAQQMDIDNVRELFGNKYDEHIEQMLEYTRSIFPEL